MSHYFKVIQEIIVFGKFTVLCVSLNTVRLPTYIGVTLRAGAKARQATSSAEDMFNHGRLAFALERFYKKALALAQCAHM